MNKKWSSIESIVFLIFALANAYPIFAHHFFPTLDGASHLYNAHCIKELFIGNEYLQGFVHLNPFPNPNWTGHFIIAFFNLFLPGWLAEKTFLLIYMIGLPYAFRYLLRAFSPQNTLASFLIFPFCYSYMLLLGFYNFSISLVFLLFTIGFWLRNKDRLTVYKSILLMLLVTATYFSHVSIYGILFPILFGLLFIDDTATLIKDKTPFRKYFRAIAIKTGILIMSFSITIYWTIHFFLQKPATIPSYLPEFEMFKNIWLIQPIIGFIQADEEQLTGKIFYILMILALVVLIKRLDHLSNNFNFSFRKPWQMFMKIFNKGDLWMVFGFVLMLAYFKLPDSDGWAGYFSLRILLLFFLMFIIWLGTQYIPKLFLIIAIIGISFFQIKLLVFRDKITTSLNKEAQLCYQASEFIRPNSTLYPINRNGNWLFAHFNKYLGIDKSVVILENNECNENYFPLTWNTRKKPQMYIDNSGDLDTFFPNPFNGNNGRQKIDYLFILGNPDTLNSSDKKLELYTQNHCKKVYDNGFVSLFENNR
jgi:hypothetical protein